MLLVDMDVDPVSCNPGDVVVVRQENAEGSIPVNPQKPTSQKSQRLRIFLAKVKEPSRFTHSVTEGIQFPPEEPAEIGKIELSPNQEDVPLYDDEIIGIVIGIWVDLRTIMEDSSDG
jgi:hypothetical protein